LIKVTYGIIAIKQNLKIKCNKIVGIKRGLQKQSDPVLQHWFIPPGDFYLRKNTSTAVFVICLPTFVLEESRLKINPGYPKACSSSLTLREHDLGC